MIKNIIQHADFGRCAGYSDHKVAQAEQTCAFGVSMFAAVAPCIYAKIEDTQRTMGQGFAKEYQSNHKNHLAYLALYEKYRKLGNFTENELFHR